MYCVLTSDTVVSVVLTHTYARKSKKILCLLAQTSIRAFICCLNSALNAKSRVYFVWCNMFVMYRIRYHRHHHHHIFFENCTSTWDMCCDVYRTVHVNQKLTYMMAPLAIFDGNVAKIFNYNFAEKLPSPSAVNRAKSDSRANSFFVFWKYSHIRKYDFVANIYD